MLEEFEDAEDLDGRKSMLTRMIMFQRASVGLGFDHTMGLPVEPALPYFRDEKTAAAFTGWVLALTSAELREDLQQWQIRAQDAEGKLQRMRYGVGALTGPHALTEYGQETTYLVARGFIGLSLEFWKLGCNGYTTDILQAHFFSEADAREVYKNSLWQDLPFKLSDLLPIAHPVCEAYGPEGFAPHQWAKIQEYQDKMREAAE